MKNRPLIFWIFWLTIIFGGGLPVVWLVRGYANFWIIDYLKLENPSEPSPTSLVKLLGVADLSAAVKMGGFWALGVFPGAFAIVHFRTIELLHRSLSPDDMPPSLIPTDEQTPSLADPEDRSHPPKTRLNELGLYAYHSYRIWKWFWGIIANPTFGEFFRVVLVKLPDPWNSWILNPIWDQVRRFLSWIIGIIGEILRGVPVKLPDSWIRGNLYRIWGCFRGFLTSITGAVLRVVLVALTLSPAILLFVIWLLWPLIFQSWTSILTHINLNLSPTMLFLFFCFFLVFFPPFFDFLCLLLNTEKIFKRAQIYVELCHLLESSGKKEEIRAAMEKQLRKYEEKGETSLHSITRESLFQVFNAQEKIESYFSIQQELPEFSWKCSCIFFLNHVALGRMVVIPKASDANPLTWRSIFESSARNDLLVFKFIVNVFDFFATVLKCIFLPVFKCIACYTPERVKKIFREHCGKQCSLLKPKFLCPVKVESGFLSPTYLVSGLLSEFDEDWQLIVRNYGLDMAWKEDPLLQGKTATDKLTLPKLRKLQSFIWMCWIQWGPSIPIHGSDNWTSGSTENSGPIGLQYGYGDENNSLPLFLKENNNTKERLQWDQLKEHYQNWQTKGLNAASSKKLSVVIPTSLTANLVWVRPDDNVCKAQRKNELFLALEAINDDKHIECNWHESKMYSAYVWVIFAVCVKVKSQTHQSTENREFPALLFPWNENATDNQRNKQAWRGLIPFFQHGNIAEPTVYESIKKELACKTLHTLKEYLDPKVQLDDGILEISFACAFDENGDGSRTASSTPSLASRSGDTIRAYMAYELKNTYQGEDWTDRLHLEEHAVPEITSCRMPEIVRQYFKSIRANSLSHDELRDDNHWQDLRDLTEETGDENSLRKTILNSAYQLCKSGLHGEEEPEGLAQLRERLWGDKKAQEPETHFLVFGKDLDDVSKCKVLGCLGIEWYPSIECGRFTHLAVDPLFRKQGIGRELIWRGSVVLRDSAAAAGKSLKGIFTWIKGSDEADTESSENPRDTLIRLGAKIIQSENLTCTRGPQNGFTQNSTFLSFESEFIDIKSDKNAAILEKLILKNSMDKNLH